jgi:hypothetical protein
MNRVQHLESLGFIEWTIRLLSCRPHDDALLQAAAMAAASFASHAEQRTLLHKHGVELAAGECL